MVKTINQMKNVDSEPFSEDNFQQAIIYDRLMYRDRPGLRLGFKVVLLFTMDPQRILTLFVSKRTCPDILPAKE